MKTRLETYIFDKDVAENHYKVTNVTPELKEDEQKEAKRKLSEKLYAVFVKYEKSNK